MLTGFGFDHATAGISFEYFADFCNSMFLWSVLSFAVAVPSCWSGGQKSRQRDGSALNLSSSVAICDSP